MDTRDESRRMTGAFEDFCGDRRGRGRLGEEGREAAQAGGEGEEEGVGTEGEGALVKYDILFVCRVL